MKGSFVFSPPGGDLNHGSDNIGLEHHFSITYSDQITVLNALAKPVGLEVVDL
jgi:hypothetical protein